MQGGEQANNGENNHETRLLTLSVPKRQSQKFERHPYDDGRYFCV